MTADISGLRALDDIARRAAALCIVSATAEALEPEASRHLLEHFEAEGATTADERDFLLTPDGVDHDDALPYQWRVEAYVTLLWVLGYLPSLQSAERTSDGRAAADVLTSSGSLPAFVAGAALRPIDEVVEQADATAALYEECRKIIAATGRAPEHVLYPVVHQRHHAFRWVLTPDAEWDAVDPSR